MQVLPGGLEGLGDFAAGLAGAASGYYAGNAIVHGTTNLNSQGLPRSSLSPESQEAVNDGLGKGNFEQVKQAVEQGTGKPSGLSGNDVAEVIANGGQSGTAGAGGNPDINSLSRAEIRATALKHYDEFWGGLKGLIVDKAKMLVTEVIPDIFGAGHVLYEAVDAELSASTGKGLLGHIEGFMKNPKNWEGGYHTKFHNEWNARSWEKIYGYGK